MSKEQDFVKPDDPILTRIAEEIPIDQINSPETKNIIEKLLDVAYDHREDRTKPTVVGLAAPQIGISKRIIVVDTKAEGQGKLSPDLQIFINPKIISKSKEEERWCEGCWSTAQVCGVVSRPHRIILEAYTTEATLIKLSLFGYPARIVQHEVDHLNGIEFVNHVHKASDLHWVEEFEWPQYKEKGGWRSWAHKCPQKKWEEIKGIKR